MITLIIAVVLGLVILVISYLSVEVKKKDGIIEQKEAYETAEIWGFVACICLPLLTIFGIAPLVQSTQQKEFVEQERIAIYSIKTETGMYGSFYLGCGQIQTEMYYFYYTQGDFGYKIEKTKANDIEIVEREDTNKIGYIVKYEEEFVKPNKWFSLSGKVLFSKKKTVIYVPKGTIQIEYNISV